MRADTHIIRWNAPSVRTLDIEGRLAKLLEPETLAHVYRTAEFARGLAERHGEDPDRAELAGLLHEVAADYSDPQLLALAEEYEIEVSPVEARVPQLLHGKLGAEILRREWGLTDEALLEAVRCHVSGAPRMGTLAKIIFLADKLEPHRDRFYRDLDPVRQLAATDLDRAIAALAPWRLTDLPVVSAGARDRLAPVRDRLIELTRATWPA